MAIAITGHEQFILAGRGSIVVCGSHIVVSMPAFNDANLVQHMLINNPRLL
jgi:hypothetical protein